MLSKVAREHGLLPDVCITALVMWIQGSLDTSLAWDGSLCLSPTCVYVTPGFGCNLGANEPVKTNV
ncbi:MAG: hypothetical protein ACREDR_39570 [Blastocatellia bacterium]